MCSETTLREGVWYASVRSRDLLLMFPLPLMFTYMMCCVYHSQCVVFLWLLMWLIPSLVDFHIYSVLNTSTTLLYTTFVCVSLSILCEMTLVSWTQQHSYFIPTSVIQVRTRVVIQYGVCRYHEAGSGHSSVHGTRGT